MIRKVVISNKRFSRLLAFFITAFISTFIISVTLILTVITVWVFTNLLISLVLVVSFYKTANSLYPTWALLHQQALVFRQEAETSIQYKLRIYSSYTLGRISTCNELRGPIKLACNIVTYLHNYTFYSENYIVPIWY